MLAYSFEVKALLSFKWKLDGRSPMNFCGLHISISEGLVKLIVICSVNQF